MAATRDDILRLTEAATAIALSVLLGNLRLLELPSGGSITLACVPQLALASVRGLRTGLLACACAGSAHALAGGTIVHPVQLVLDYGIGYAALALVALVRAVEGTRLTLGILLAALVQLAAATLSGVVFFAAGTGAHGAGLVAASLAYNAATIVPEALLAIWLVPRATRALCRADPARAWRSGLLAPPRLTQRMPRAAPPRTSHPAVHADGAPPIPAAPRIRPAFIRPAPFLQLASRPAPRREVS